MEEKKKKKLPDKIAFRILLTLLIAFLSIYISTKTGYYEYELHSRVSLTEEKIREFEQDVNDGKQINIKDYLDSVDINYSNNISNFGLNVSKMVTNSIKSSIDVIFKFMNDKING